MKGNLSNKGSCILRIQGALGSLNAAEQRSAKYVLHHMDEAVNLTIEELAERAGTSYATIMRLCKRLGYTGYKEFKSSLINDVILNQGIDKLMQNLAVSRNATAETVSEQVYNLAISTLEDGYRIMDPDVVDRCVERMLSARSVLFIGSGNSGISARYAHSKFFRIGMNSQTEADTTLYRMMISLLTDADVLFVISSSGRTGHIIEAANLAKRNGVTVISLSDYAISPLTKLSDFNLHTTPRNASLFLDIDMPLFIGQIAIIDVLYSCCCTRLAERASDFYEKTRASSDAEKIT